MCSGNSENDKKWIIELIIDPWFSFCRFFRIHFGLNEILYAGIIGGRSVAYGRDVKQVFGIVAKQPRAMENSVIILAELEPGRDIDL